MAMIKKRYVTIREFGQPDKEVDASLIEGLTTKQIESALLNNNINYSVAVRTPSAIYCCEPDLILSHHCPTLIHEDQTKEALHLLQIVRKKENEKRISLIFKVIADNVSILIPNLIIKFNLLEFNQGKTGLDLKNYIINKFDISSEKCKVYINNRELMDSTIANPTLLTQMINSKLTFKCDLKKESIELMYNRETVLKEIKSSEEVYFERISCLNTYFKQSIIESKLLNREKIDQVFQFFEPLLEVHAEFYRDLDMIGTNYSAVVLPTFLKNIPTFSVVRNYIKNKPSIDKIVNEIKNKEKMRKIEEENPVCPGVSFDSFLIAPIQRYPKYGTLFQSLIKYTPKCHPDMKYYKGAKKALEEMINQCSNTDEIIKNIKLLDNIGDRINFRITIPGRYLMEITEVTDVDSKKRKIRVYLFNDMILVSESVKRTYRENLLFHSMFEEADLHDSPMSENELVISKKKKINIEVFNIRFSNESAKYLFVEKFKFYKQDYLDICKYRKL